MFFISILVLIAIFLKILGVPTYALILAPFVLLTLFILVEMLQRWSDRKVAENIVSAELLEEVNVYRETTKNTGYSVGKNGRYFHYSYVKEPDHVRCIFKVKRTDGSYGNIKCKKGSTLYGELWKKSKKKV